MHFARIPPGLALLAGLLALAACGGGGGGGTLPAPSAPVTTASLDGQVLEVDGQTTALAGIAITLAETGQTAVTGADGSFDFGDVPTGSLTLALAAPPTSTFLTLASGPDDGPGGMDDSGHHGGGADDGSEIEDGEDLHGNGEVAVHRAQNQEQIRVRLRIRDGEIAQLECSREGDGEREAEVVMDRSTDSDDADITGKLEVESRGLREKFEVEVEHATPDRVLELVVVDLDGNEESQGTRTVDADGWAQWELDTSDGDALPFDAASVAELEGFGVEVRDADDARLLLDVDVPELPPLLQQDGHGGEGGGSGSDDAERLRARVRLEAQVAGLEGHVELRSRVEDGEECLEMEAEHLQAGQGVAFEIETGEQTGQFSQIRQRTANEDGEAQLEINTRHGDTLPGGASGVRELVRLRVQVRDVESGELLLSGTIPDLVVER